MAVKSNRNANRRLFSSLVESHDSNSGKMRFLASSKSENDQSESNLSIQNDHIILS